MKISTALIRKTDTSPPYSWVVKFQKQDMTPPNEKKNIAREKNSQN